MDTLKALILSSLSNGLLSDISFKDTLPLEDILSHCPSYDPVKEDWTLDELSELTEEIFTVLQDPGNRVICTVYSAIAKDIATVIFNGDKCLAELGTTIDKLAEDIISKVNEVIAKNPDYLRYIATAETVPTGKLEVLSWDALEQAGGTQNIMQRILYTYGVKGSNPTMDTVRTTYRKLGEEVAKLQVLDMVEERVTAAIVDPLIMELDKYSNNDALKALLSELVPSIAAIENPSLKIFQKYAADQVSGKDIPSILKLMELLNTILDTIGGARFELSMNTSTKFGENITILSHFYDYLALIVAHYRYYWSDKVLLPGAVLNADNPIDEEDISSFDLYRFNYLLDNVPNDGLTKTYILESKAGLFKKYENKVASVNSTISALRKETIQQVASSMVTDKLMEDADPHEQRANVFSYVAASWSLNASRPLFDILYMIFLAWRVAHSTDKEKFNSYSTAQFMFNTISEMYRKSAPLGILDLTAERARPITKAIVAAKLLVTTAIKVDQ